MVNAILPPEIIRDNPDIRYKPYLEYLEGDNLYLESYKIRNETKSFLCKNVLYNDELVRFNRDIIKYETHKPKLEYDDFQADPDMSLFEKYGGIIGHTVVLRFSYDDIFNVDPVEPAGKTGTFNSKLFTDSHSDFQVIPVVYRDFYSDIGFRHMTEDYSSFSVVIDYTKGVIYANDVLLNRLKMEPSKKYDIVCTVLVNRKMIDRNDPFYAIENQNENGLKVLDLISKEINVPGFSLKYLPHAVKRAVISNPSQFVTDDLKYCVSVTNMPYSIYSQFVTNVNGTLYYNPDYGYFSEDKNQTAINVLAYDICMDGFKKPIVINKYDGNFIVQSKTRFLIAQYLRLPTIPVVIYTEMSPKSEELARINVFEKGQRIKIPDTPGMRVMMYPDMNPAEAVQIRAV